MYFHVPTSLRQGCPLSSNFFALYTHTLSWKLNLAVQQINLTTYPPMLQIKPISHSLFAADCVLIAKATLEYLEILWRTITKLQVRESIWINVLLDSDLKLKILPSNSCYIFYVPLHQQQSGITWVSLHTLWF